MARTVGDVALMLAAMAGPDDRAPLSYDVDTRQFTAAVKRPSIKGWRVAWTPDLNGLIPVDHEVAAVAERALAVFRAPRREGRAGLPRFHRGQRHRAGHPRARHGRAPRRQARALGIGDAEGARVEHQAGALADPRADRQRREAPHPPLAPGARLHGDARSADPAHRRDAAVPGGAALSPPRSTARRSTTTPSGSSSPTASRSPRCPSSRCRAASRRAGCRWACRSSGGATRRPRCSGPPPPSRPPRPGRTGSRRWCPRYHHDVTTLAPDAGAITGGSDS